MWKAIEYCLWLGIVVFAFLCLGPVSPGGRQFFSPDSLEVRSQSELLLVGLEIPVYRSGFSRHRFELTDFLITNGYWQTRCLDEPRWILVNHWNALWRDGHSMLLRELSLRGSDWIAWSRTHPDLASVVWPQVLELLRNVAEESEEQVVLFLWHARYSVSVDDLNRRLSSDPDWAVVAQRRSRNQ